ncbi:MAG: c-type cytochrome biogenesis protein CcsB [Planctomycetota bacterium]
MANALHLVFAAAEPHDALYYALGIFFDVSLYAYLFSTIALAIWFLWRPRALLVAGISLLGLGLVMQVGYLVVRGMIGGRPPFANTFETLILLAACLVAFFLVMLKNEEWRPMAPLAALAGLMVTVYAWFITPDEVEPLLPALRDNFWLTVHVIFCFVSYAAFILSYIGALAFLAREPRHAKGGAFACALTLTGLAAAVVMVAISGTDVWHESRSTVLLASCGGAVALALGLWPIVGIVDKELGLRKLLPEKEVLGRMTYKAVALGFPFLTLGIVTGSVWASQAWGRYWGWDPKETASLITWFVFALYLHLRLVPKWRGPWVAWVAVGGFWCVLFTYFGVNYLLTGLHAYGG